MISLNEKDKKKIIGSKKKRLNKKDLNKKESNKKGLNWRIKKNMMTNKLSMIQDWCCNRIQHIILNKYYLVTQERWM